MWNKEGTVYTVADRYDKAKKRNYLSDKLKKRNFEGGCLPVPNFQDRLGRKILVESGLIVTSLGNDTIEIKRGDK